jgi:very-short-patch-repair endonuclease
MEDKTEVLVAFLPNKKDFAILQEQRWYRIPIASRPKRWPPKYLAFYQPKAFGDDAFKIRYYGLVKNIDIVTRKELFPNEFESERSEKRYYRLGLESLQEWKKPIPSRLPRRIVFVPTTWDKFIHAEQMNDLFDDSPLEDLLWGELKRRHIPAERQWNVRTETFNYQLDFAFFCNDGNLDVETDGDTWHLQHDRVELDNRRNNDLEALGWHVLRFNSKVISEQRADYCIPRIQETINRLGGLSDDGLVPRKFYPKADGIQQLSLFENKTDYETDDELDFD